MNSWRMTPSRLTRRTDARAPTQAPIRLALGLSPVGTNETEHRIYVAQLVANIQEAVPLLAGEHQVGWCSEFAMERGALVTTITPFAALPDEAAFHVRVNEGGPFGAQLAAVGIEDANTLGGLHG